MEPNSTPGVCSPPPSDANTSPANPIFALTDTDHPDSPIRKKPRLHQGDQSDSAMSDEPLPQTAVLSKPGQDPQTPPPESPRTPDQIKFYALPPTPTPSKITTLNLKSSKSNSSYDANGHIPEPLSDTTQEISQSTPLKSRFHSLSIPATSPTKASTSDSPLSSLLESVHGPNSPERGESEANLTDSESPTLHIDVGEPEDMDSDNPDPVVEICNVQLSGTDLVEKFPRYKNAVGMAAAKTMAASMDRCDVFASQIESVSSWLVDWVACTREISAYRSTAYRESAEFWTTFGIIMHKLIQRKTNMDALVHGRSKKSAELLLESVFEPYLQICMHLLQIDRADLFQNQVEPASQRDMMSFRHLQNMQSILAFGDSPLGLMARKTYETDPDQVQPDLAFTFMDDDASSFGTLIDFGLFISERVDLWPALKELLPICLSIVAQIGSSLAKCRSPQPQARELDRNHRYTECATGLAAMAASKLMGQIPQQAATFSTDWNKDMIRFCSEIFLEACKISPQRAAQMVDLIDPNCRVAELDPEYFPEIVCNDQRLNWTICLLKRGRLELRVLGVIVLQDMLINLHANYLARQGASLHPILLQMSALLLYYRVMDHILKVDSHPQVIQRSGLILAFLHITKQYPPHLTERIWELITESPDSRIFLATLQMMHTCLQHIGNLDDLVSFCRKFAKLPFDAYTPELIRFFECLMDAMSHRLQADSTSDEKLEAPQLCLRLVQESSGVIQTGGNSRMLHDISLNSLHLLSLRVTDLPARRQLYFDCINEIKSGSSSATGSVEALHTILYPYTASDIPVLVDEMDLPTLSAKDLCRYVEDQIGITNSFVQIKGLNARLELFKHLQIFGPNVLSNELLSDVWNHIVGVKSLDYDDARNQGWNCLCDIVSQFDRTHSFAEKCINEYLPTLEPRYFTHNMCQFIQAANQYSTRTTPSPTLHNGDIIPIPLLDLLWTILMTATDPIIVQNAIKMLCFHYLDDDLIQMAPRLSIDKTHAALIDKSVKQLQTAARKLKLSNIEHDSDADKSMHDSPADVELRDAELCFTHTVQFLKQFLTDVAARNFFKTEASEGEYLPTKPEHDLKLNEYTTKIRFQAFESGNQMQVHDLTISDHATLSELQKQILDMTGFSKISVIVGGQLISLANKPTELVASLKDKGNMIVKNIGEYSGSPRFNKKSSRSVAEKELFQHFNELYELLDLEDEWSRPLLDILHHFPPHPRVHEAVVSEEATIPELFPEGRMVRSSYSLRSMRNHLHNQMKSGTTDDIFLREGVRTLTAVLTGPQVEATFVNSCDEFNFVPSLVDCLVCFLKERPRHTSEIPYFSDPGALVDRLCLILQSIMRCPSPSRWNDLTCNTYTALIEASLHELEVWASFTSRNESEELHHWLLLGNSVGIVRRHIETTIEGVCEDIPMPVAVQTQEFTAYYWHILGNLIPQSANLPAQSEQLLNTAVSVLRMNSNFDVSETALRSYVSEWGSLLLRHCQYLIAPRHEEDVDIFVLGVTKLLSACVQILKSLKKPLHAGDLIQNLFNAYLFPEPIENLSSALSFTQPVIILDSGTRKELYDLVMALCDDLDTHLKLVRTMGDLISTICTTDEANFNSERASWMRSTAGYLGLKNLAHTCYINSLMSQLFLNGEFRNFLMELDPTASSESKALLLEIQKMFGYMTNSTDKYVDTADFVGSIKPFDANQIDPSVQMDVDEFYNLLFERLEEQMPSAQTRSQLRSFYGGELVTQIRSTECQHVSEKPEPFLAIQCEVKGKANLVESLKAYVEGDVMEGDNKYKCESCGGQLVNAVKRSSLKETPDNLVFHLKRFDFDIQHLQRMKINDRFDFPDKIDMTPYTVQYLSDDREHTVEDIFVLTGVLVHAGSTESGHYYSLIRIAGPEAAGYGTWAEFNDTHVNLIDSRDIPSMAFGGNDMSPGGRTLKGQKVWNAYMLFYKRASAVATEQKANTVTSVAAKHFAKLPGAEGIIRDNQRRSFRFCLFDPGCSHFIQSLLIRMKDLRSGVCSDNHGIEKETLTMFMDYFEQVIIRIKDCPGHLEALDTARKIALNCPTCAFTIIEWVTNNADAFQNLLFLCPNLRVRTSFAEFIVAILRDLRSKDVDLYGLNIDNMNDSSSINQQGAFPKTFKLLKAQIPELGLVVHSWESYFLLLREIAGFGWQELSVLAGNGILKTCLELLLLEYVPEARLSHLGTYDSMRRSSRKTFSYNEIIRLVGVFLSHANIFSETIQDSWDRIPDTPTESRMANQISLTFEERAFLEFFDSNSRQLSFIGKILESWDEDRERCVVPCSIVAALLKAGPTSVFVKRLTSTLKVGINNYLPTYLTAYLEAAVIFCQRSSNEGKICEVIDAVATSSEDLENHNERRELPVYFRHWKLTLDNDWVMPQGGWDHITTLDRISRLRNDHVATEERPFMGTVTQLAHRWAPPLLIYDGEDEGQVRQAAYGLLQDLIFKRFEDASPNGQGPSDHMFVRTVATNDLLESCIQKIQDAIGVGLPKHLIEFLAITSKECYKFIRRLTVINEPSYDGLKGKIEPRLPTKWLSVERFLMALPDQDDLQIADESDEYEDSFETEEDEFAGRI